MRRIAIWICASLWVLIATAGCGEQEPKLTLEQVKEALHDEGLVLSEAEVTPANVFIQPLLGVVPTMFRFDSGEKISIYIFPSSKDAANGPKEFDRQTATATVVAHQRLLTHNVLAFYIYNRNAVDPRVDAAFQKLQKK